MSSDGIGAAGARPPLINAGGQTGAAAVTGLAADASGAAAHVVMSQYRYIAKASGLPSLPDTHALHHSVPIG
jgi:hypothetical protein